MDGVDEKAYVIDGADEIAHATESTSVIITRAWSVAAVVKVNESALAESLLDETAELTEVTTVPTVVLTMVGETAGVLKTVENTVETAEIGVQIEANESMAEALDVELLDALDTEAVAEVVAIS